ncbi:cytochrome c oxidase accessory protein FixG [Andreprevotia lacus DSM 23236]|jgi:cytochrome c oxidase accessory protein FixG|uniref:Cytochrome c oxidase accessory protein FixG n=1 Tax=Andreprevotia lacus DSM 23236 TaxID=1121001 RepID=A0A1W1XDZ0_9NEIS|nr:cytochrome c oxidase accessory protein CcoG [Andreprevotia lacus]SMC22097.1 cytochrome c oxidase accessory protein FixG [Andreprevotia lacus DSM 23236]
MSKKLADIPVKVIPADDIDEYEEISLYAKHKKIYPRWVTGYWNNWRIFFVFATQLFFYGVPWLQVNGRQAMLFDVAREKFYVFGMVFLPQDFVYLTALLLMCALGLFVWTAIGGRLWCGYSCPQTVYTEIFLWIEKWVEGDRPARLKLDTGPANARKIRLKTIKHTAWIVFSLWTGFTFVGYFTPIRDLWTDLSMPATSPWEAFWVLFYGFATYGNAGWLREQVCKYMCPYARFQSAMFDKDTLIISYDEERGESRGKRQKGSDYKAEGLGDCIDCTMCVQVCPVGIDIREGLQYECIGCAACIDACDSIMDKMNYPRGLIRYTSENALKHSYVEKDIVKHIMRPRVIMYGLVLLIALAATVAALMLRQPIKVNIARDRVALVRETEDGLLENSYRLQIENADENRHVYLISADGIDGLKWIVDGGNKVKLDSTGTVEVGIRLQADPAKVGPGSREIHFVVQAEDAPDMVSREKSSFIGRP